MLDEVGDVPRDGHVAGHGKFRAGEESLELAEKGWVRLRFEQGDEVAEEGDARRGVGVGRCVQTPVRGENLAGFLQLAEQDDGEGQIVVVMDGRRMDENVETKFLLRIVAVGDVMPEKLQRGTGENLCTFQRIACESTHVHCLPCVGRWSREHCVIIFRTDTKRQGYSKQIYILLTNLDRKS